LRITSGTHRGRLIKTLPGNSTRPTSERLRQSWLNSLQMKLPDSRVLDLFSGSGALGLEALSRGAAFVIFVEENPKAARVILENARALGLQDSVRVIQRKVEQVQPMIASEPPFDFVFVDPPYDQGYEEKLLSGWSWDRCLGENGILCIESAYRKGGGFPPPAGLAISRDERYGDSQLTFYVRKEGTLNS
jgi:16S rRNA (guanine966-N2)-methyltransferase